jgi:hypothetical protein
VQSLAVPPLNPRRRSQLEVGPAAPRTIVPDVCNLEEAIHRFANGVVAENCCTIQRTSPHLLRPTLYRDIRQVLLGSAVVIEAEAHWSHPGLLAPIRSARTGSTSLASPIKGRKVSSYLTTATTRPKGMCTVVNLATLVRAPRRAEL